MSLASDLGFQRHRLTVAEYHRMGEVGLLTHDARVELIEGEVIDMAPIGSRHAYVVNQLTRLLVQAVGERAVVAVQQPVRLGPRSEPQPDLSLARAPAANYLKSHPRAGDVLLLIEVSDTTLRYDRDIKVPLYAQHGIPEVWLIDVNSMQLQCMRQPEKERYLSVTVVTTGVIEIACLPGIGIDLSSVLSISG